MRRVTYDPSISLGNVIQILVLLAAMATGFGSLRERIAAVELMIRPLWSDFLDRRAPAPREP